MPGQLGNILLSLAQGRQMDDIEAQAVQQVRAKLPAGVACGLVFLDPPYGKSLGTKALSSAVANGWVGKGALVVWEENQPQIAPPGFTRLDQRRYGDSWITFLRYQT